MLKKKMVLFGIFAGSIMVLSGCCLQNDKGQEISARIEEVKYGRDAIITITSDDGFYDSGLLLNTVIQKYNLKASCSAPVIEVNNNLQGWKEIEKQGKMEVIDHSYTHVVIPRDGTMSEREVEFEIANSKKWLDEQFATDQIVYVPSNNSLSLNAYKILKKNDFYAVRQGGRGYNSLSPDEGNELGQWYNLVTQGIGDVAITNERNIWIDEAIKQKAWLIEMWHCVSNDNFGYQPITTDMADEHLSYIAKKQNEEKVWVAGFVEATKYIREKQNCEVKAYDNKGKIQVYLKLNTKKLSPRVFNEELTIKVKVNDKWDKVEVIQGKVTKEIDAISEEDGKYVLIEIIPENKVTTILEAKQ